MSEQKTVIPQPVVKAFLGGAIVLVPPQQYEINGKIVNTTAYLAVNETSPSGSRKPKQARVLTRPALEKLREIINSSDVEELLKIMPKDISEVSEPE